MVLHYIKGLKQGKYGEEIKVEWKFDSNSSYIIYKKKKKKYYLSFSLVSISKTAFFGL